MEFRFNLNDLFQEPIMEIGSSLVPPKFTGDKRALWDTQSKITQIVNAMGEASANAQGLSKPITTADRLRNSEHKLYLLIDNTANNGKGAVTGMLKTGEKGLYVFDREGQHYQVSPPCVLDFYIHESRQRSGYGKNLFEHMLQKQQIEPVKMAIDRPSDKLLGFLNKHYGLNSPVKQMNNYVVYDGFFPKTSESTRTVEADKSFTPRKKQSANGLQHGIPSSPYGRYGAPRPPCSMGQIIHNDSAVIKRNQEPAGVRSEPITNVQGQRNMYNSYQMPAWQVTQSVPNVPFPQNQQNYSPIPQHQAPNQQYAPNTLYQQFSQNQNGQYPPSSGDYSINTASQQIKQPVDQNAVQDYSQAYYSHTVGQGDATSQTYKYQAPTDSTERQTLGQNGNQVQYRQVSNPNEAQRDLKQNQPQVFTYQGQNYCFNPQTQQYQMIPDPYQQNLTPNDYRPQVYQNQMPVQAQQYNQDTSQRIPYSQQSRSHQQREPLRPQNLDGTVRRVQQSVSVPVQKTGMQERQNVPVLVHETTSAPVSYQYQPAITSNQESNGPGRPYSPTTTPQVTNPNETVNHVIPQNEIVAPQLQHQPNAQIYPQNQTNNQIHQGQGGNQNFNAQNVTQAPQSIPNNQMMSQTPHVNQMPTQRIQNVQQVPSMPQVAVNVQNSSVPQQNMTHQPMGQDSNLPQDNYQHVGTNQSSNVENTEQTTQNAVNYPNSNQIMAQPISVNQIDNQMAMLPQQNVQQVAGMQQQQMVYQHQPQKFDSQQTMISANHNENITVGGPQLNANHVGHDSNRFLQNEAVGRYPAHINVKSNGGQETRHVRQDKEIDYSKGYPPQHHQNSTTSRPPIIIRNYEKPAQNSTPKADRPQSLNIETAEDLERRNNDHVVASAHEEALYGDQDDSDSIDVDLATLEAIEQEIEKIDVAPKESTPVSKGSKSPGMEAAGIVTPGRNTPGLTEQGYFDLKFYHNKLW